MQVLSGEDEIGNDHTNWREDIFQGMQVQQLRRAEKNAKATPLSPLHPAHRKHVLKNIDSHISV